MLVVFIALLVGGAIAVYQLRQTRQADATLARAGNGIRAQVERFHRQHDEYPNDLQLRPSAVGMGGTSGRETNTIDLAPGVRLVWYSDKPDPRLSTTSQRRGTGYAYCLAFHDRHWRLNATEDAVVTGGPPEGDCPQAPSR
jgi:hypothetical protein